MAIHDIVRVLDRGIRLRCPRCEAAPLFRGLFAMHDRCGACGLRFEREQGYFVGAIYVNYGVTVTLTIGGYLALDHYGVLDLATQIVLWSCFAVVFPLVFFRFSRSLWLSIEYLCNPEAPEAERQR